MSSPFGLLRALLTRRRWLQGSAAALAVSTIARPSRAAAPADVLVVRTEDPVAAVQATLARFGADLFASRTVALKANYNSEDPFPASTSPDTLDAFLAGLKAAGAAGITLAERSGMGDTAAVLKATGADRIAARHGAALQVIDDLGEDGYVHVRPEGGHWSHGFKLARVFAEADRVVQTCCLKTHRFGGHFTLSLKNAVGAVAKRDPVDGYDYMRELHGSPHQRAMIAEIATAFRNDLILMDARRAFVRGGPDRGELVAPGLFVAGRDPVAVDAVGVAILRLYDTTPEVATGPVFDLDQLARAAELGIGVGTPADIQLLAADAGSQELAERIGRQLA